MEGLLDLYSGVLCVMVLWPPRSTRTATRWPYTTLFRSYRQEQRRHCTAAAGNALPKEGPDGTPLGERFTGPDRPKDADGKEEGDRSEASFDLVVQRLLGGAESAGPSTPEFSQRADNHQQGERHPEYAVLPDDREIAAEPEPLIRKIGRAHV